MRGRLFLFVFIVSLLGAAKIVTHPDPERTPGSLCTTTDSDFIEYRYDEKIPYCQRNVSDETKDEAYQSYNVHGDTSNYTIDHLIPLSFGGSNHPDNLWPQHKSASTSRVEYELYLQLSAGEITQEEAIRTILKIKFGKC